MRKNELLALLSSLFVISLLLPSATKAVSVGTAPGTMNIGKLERGERYAIDFYLMTDEDNPVLTKLRYTDHRRNLLQQNETGPYTFIPMFASQEDTSDWIKFQNKEVLVDPDKNEVIKYPDGVINADQKATFFIDVPSDAEPGYHAFEVDIKPSVQGGGQGTAVTTVGVTRPLFIFQVPGDPVRDGVIDGITATRDGGRARFDVLFRNTGTVTVSAEISELRIYNETGYYIETVQSGPVKIPPKDTRVISAYWSDDNTTVRKDRRVEATVDYITGKVSKESMVTIPKESVVTQAIPEPEEVPWWLIIILVGCIILAVYYWWY